MPHSTEDVALKILEALQKELTHEPKDVLMRKPLGTLTKELMEKHKWQELDFLQAWGFVMKNRYAKGEQLHGGFYAQPTAAGREFIKEHYPERYPVKNRRPLFYAAFLTTSVVVFGLLWWQLKK
jgi:hypothetical protein